VLLGLLAAACSAPEPPSESERPRHVLVILIDTLRAGHLSCYGYGRRTSPNIDRLAWRGVRFTHCTAQSSWTGPSMVSLFTGRYLADERMSIPEGLPTLPELFSSAGYRTGAFVVNPILHNEENGFRRGFDTFETKAGFKRIADWIASTAGEPTLTYVHWVDPHDPYGPSEEYHYFMKEPAQLTPKLTDYYQRAATEMGLSMVEASTAKIAAAIAGYDDDIRLVDSKVDILVGALREAGILERSVVVIASDHGEGLWKRPDYPQLAEAGRVAGGDADGPTRVEASDGDGGDGEDDDPETRAFEKPVPAPVQKRPRTVLSTHKMTHGNQLFEELVHVPLIFHAPAFATNRTIDDQVENVDILPTLLEMANIPVPPRLSGQSLLPVMRGDLARAESGTGVSVTRWFRSFRTADGLKVIAPTAAGLEVGLTPELYDLAPDPDERKNLFERDPGRAVDLMLRLEDALEDGLPGDREISEANREAMRNLGYVE
jgi:arylsulfatase A-like enzyme